MKHLCRANDNPSKLRVSSRNTGTAATKRGLAPAADVAEQSIFRGACRLLSKKYSLCKLETHKGVYMWGDFLDFEIDITLL